MQDCVSATCEKQKVRAVSLLSAFNKKCGSFLETQMFFYFCNLHDQNGIPKTSFQTTEFQCH